jgi:hypothetical protein
LATKSKIQPLHPSSAEVSPELPRLPHNLEAERSILGAIMLDNRALDVATKKVRSDDFFLPQHRQIFARMVQLAEKQKPIDIVTLMEDLSRRNELEAAGGTAYLSQLADGLPKVTNIGHYCDIVKEKSALRTVIHAAAALQASALARDAVPEDLEGYVQMISAAIEKPAPAASVLTIPDMPEDVLDGRLGEICQARLAGLPRAYAWPALATVAGTLVPPTAKVRTNLFCGLIGPKDTGKSQAIERAVSAIGLIKPHLEDTLAGSFEGLAEKLDVNGDARLLSPDELGHLLTKAQIDGASFPYVLNSAYYKTEFDVTAARGKKIHVNCRLGFIGGIVDTNFGNLFGAASTYGLHDRCIFGRCPAPYEFRYRPFEGPPEITEPCPVTIAGDVWEVRDEWLKSIPGLTPRCAEHAIRVAVVAASFSGRSILYARHIEKSGRAFAEYQVRMRQAFKPNPGENTDARCAFAILAALSDSSGWIPKRDIAKKIHSERYGPSVFERAINAQVAAGDIVVDGKRPARIRLVQDGAK